MKMAENKNFNIAVEGDVESFAHISSLYLSPKYSDFAVVVESQELPAHQVIVCGRSAYFKSSVEKYQEMVHIGDISFFTLEKFLKYIYTGKFSFRVPSLSALFSIMELAYRLSLFELLTKIATYLYPLICFKHVVDILNMATVYKLEELTERCCKFLDYNAHNILSHVDYRTISEKSMVAIIDRDSFCLDEIEIFKLVISWQQYNTNNLTLVLGSVRFPLISEADVKRVVVPNLGLQFEECKSYLEFLMNQDERDKDVYRRRRICQPLTVENVNIATKAYDAKYIHGSLIDVYVDETPNGGVIDDQDGITIEFGAIYVINYISFYLEYLDEWRKAPGALGYFIEASLNRTNWVRIVDYSRYPCSKQQELYFTPVNAKYIRVVATTLDRPNDIFQLNHLEVHNKSEANMIFEDGVAKFSRPTLLSTKFATIRSGALDEGVLSVSTSFGAKGTILIVLNQPMWLRKLSFSVDPLIQFSLHIVLWPRDIPNIILDNDVNRKGISDYDLKFAAQIVTFITIEVERAPTSVSSFKSFHLS